MLAIFDEKIEIRERCKGVHGLSAVAFSLNLSLSQGSAFCRFLFLFFVRTFCSRLFANFFDLRSWLSVSSPLRSVGTPSPSSRESCFFNPRNNLEPCTDSLELCRRVWHRRKSEQRTFGLQSTRPNGILIWSSYLKYTRRLVTRPLFTFAREGGTG